MKRISVFTLPNLPRAALGKLEKRRDGFSLGGFDAGLGVQVQFAIFVSITAFGVGMNRRFIGG